MTERVRAEQLDRRNAELERERVSRHLEKMAALGKLSAGHAHELSNPAAAAQRAAAQLNAQLLPLETLALRLSRHSLQETDWARLLVAGQK